MNNKERNNKKEEKEERKRQIEENEKPATGLGGTGVRRPQFPRFVSCQARGGALVHTADGFGRKHISPKQFWMRNRKKKHKLFTIQKFNYNTISFGIVNRKMARV